MSDRRFAIIDPAAGVSGDMLLGALVAVGAPPDWLRGLPGRLGLPGVTVEIDAVDRCGVQCTKVTVRLPDGSVEEPLHYSHGHHHHHHHHHSHPAPGVPAAEPAHGGHPHAHGPHRHVGDIIAQLRGAELSEWVRERAIAVFTLIGQAEGRVHGLAAVDVPLHEVGAVDALVDVVGVLEGFERLGLSQVCTRPLALGEGWVDAAHGTLPVPAPATTLIVEGLAIGPNGPVRGEATTPTGAALLRVLATAPIPVGWRAAASGWGAGSRNPGNYPNALRLIIAEPVEEASEVSLLAADLDDLSPEYLEPLREALVGAGAVDVQTWSTQMKKGRIGFRIEAVVPAGREEPVADALFANSTSAGLRWTRATRRTLARRLVQLQTRDGQTVRVKVLEGPAGPRVKPEFDDVSQVARASGRPVLEVAGEARLAAERLAAAAAAGQSSAHKEST